MVQNISPFWKEKNVNLQTDAEALSLMISLREYYEYDQQSIIYALEYFKILNDALDNGKRVLFERSQGLCWISAKEPIICNLFKLICGGI